MVRSCPLAWRCCLKPGALTFVRISLDFKGELLLVYFTAKTFDWIVLAKDGVAHRTAGGVLDTRAGKVVVAVAVWVLISVASYW